MPEDPAWTAYLNDLDSYEEEPLKIAAPLNGVARPEAFDAWAETNIYKQRQKGYVVATISLPLGDITSDQMRNLADIARKYVKDTIRATVEQNIILRWVSESDVVSLYNDLCELELAEPGAGTIVDVTACPGTDTCKLGISSSRGLAAELRTQLAQQNLQLHDAIKNFRIKISGCFNSCGATPRSRSRFLRQQPKNQWLYRAALPGRTRRTMGQKMRGLTVLPWALSPPKIFRPSSNASPAIMLKTAKKTKASQTYIQRIGKKDVKDLLQGLTQVPMHEIDPSYYTDWGDTREFTIGDMGKGECAGEVVSLVQFELSGCETESFESQIYLEEGDYEAAYKTAFSAMLHAAKALVKTQFLDVPEEADVIVEEFSHALLRYRVVLQPVCRRKICQLSLPPFTKKKSPNTPATLPIRSSKKPSSSSKKPMPVMVK